MCEYFPDPPEEKVACQCTNCERDIYFGEEVLNYMTGKVEILLCQECITDNTKTLEKD